MLTALVNNFNIAHFQYFMQWVYKCKIIAIFLDFWEKSLHYPYASSDHETHVEKTEKILADFMNYKDFFKIIIGNFVTWNFWI